LQRSSPSRRDIHHIPIDQRRNLDAVEHVLEAWALGHRVAALHRRIVETVYDRVAGRLGVALDRLDLTACVGNAALGRPFLGPGRAPTSFEYFAAFHRPPKQYWLGRQFLSPPDTPIFKEMSGLMNPHAISFTVAIPSQQLVSQEMIYHLTTSVQTPGYSATEHWVIYRRGTMLELCPPGHPLNPHG
jgi:hypothetical protein